MTDKELNFNSQDRLLICKNIYDKSFIMKKLFQTGLALGNVSGNCSACNIDMSWLYHTPSKLLWLDKVVVTEHLWQLIVGPKRSEYMAKQTSNNFQRDLMFKTDKLVFEILDSVELIQHIGDNFVSQENYQAIYKQIDADFDLLLENKVLKKQDSHIYSIGKNRYCQPKLWTLYFALLASRKLNANISLDEEELTYLRTLLPYKLAMDISVSRSSSAINEVLLMKIPQVNIWPEFTFSNKARCFECAKMEKCDDSYLKDVEKNLFSLLEYRQHDEIQEFCGVLNQLCDKKFAERYEVDSKDLLRELNIEKIRVQAKLNKTYKKVDNWVKIVGTISAALSLGAIFKYPELTPFGAIGFFAANVGDKVSNYFKEKYRWVNFVN